MSKIYTIVLTALLSVLTLAANAVNVTINIDDPTRVEVQVNYVTQDNLVQGDNLLEVAEYGSIQITATDGNFLSSVVKKSTSSSEYIYYMTTCSIYISSSNEGETWTVTSQNADEARDGSCKIKVDDASKVTVTRSGTSTYINNLVSGEEVEVKYITASELPLIIGPKNYGSSLYSVTLDGEPVTPQYGTSYYVTPGENSVIEIKANYPDEDVAVKFDYATEEAKGFITGVKVDGEEVTNYNDDDFTVKLGKKVSISGNTSDYKVNSFTVNGSSVSFYGSYEFTVTGETTINVDAQKYAMINATLNIDNPDNVIVYKGQYYNNNIITGLQPGDNAIEVSETNTTIQIKANSGCYITSVTSVVGEGDDAQSQTYTVDYSGYYNITVTEGMVITVVSGAIERDQTAIIYVDDVTKANYGHNFTRSDRSTIELASGYNAIEFYDGDIPAMINFYGAASVSAYKNDEVIAPDYTGGTYYTLNELADGDIVKVFLAGTPNTYNVKFNVTGEDATGDDITVIRDSIKVVDNWSGGFSTLQGTRVDIKVAEGSKVEVLIGEEKLTADENGNYTFTVNADTDVELKYPTETGITNIATGDTTGAGDIYTLQGILVKKGATAADADRLPAGLYIINGKKVVKR